MNNLPGIQRLTLSGFQVFETLTEVPLGKLTLMFGPNSAGKSAVEDALEILPTLWRLPLHEVDQKMPNESILKHWRRRPDGQLTPTMVINASLKVCLDQLDIGLCFFQYTFRTESESLYRRVQPDISNLELKTTLSTRAEFPAMQEFLNTKCKPRIESQEIYLDDALLMCSSAVDGITINFSHPALLHLPVNSDYRAIATNFNDYLGFADGLVTFKKHALLGYVTWGRRGLEREQEMSFPILPQTPEDIQNHRFVSECSYAIEEFYLYLESLENNILVPLSLDSFVVPASRHVPTTSELTHLLLADGLLGIAVSGDPRYYSLAASFASSIKRLPVEDANISIPVTEPIFEVVNHYLTNYLFLDRGYQLNFEYRFISPPYDQSTNISEVDPREILQMSSVLVTTYLADASGSRFAFEDVGSGLGYVLPILTAISEPYPTHIVVLQQPELHLHPALQAVMGDVLIDGSTRCGRVIAETHSEHLLLRILKRIRQTHSGTIVDPHQAIRADEVSVLYFDPQPDGSTTVKHLRISEDGDFLDMWPRGFFVERDQELFDE